MVVGMVVVAVAAVMVPVVVVSAVMCADAFSPNLPSETLNPTWTLNNLPFKDLDKEITTRNPKKVGSSGSR